MDAEMVEMAARLDGADATAAVCRGVLAHPLGHLVVLIDRTVLLRQAS
jgi:hypothetical protein